MCNKIQFKQSPVDCLGTPCEGRSKPRLLVCLAFLTHGLYCLYNSYAFVYSYRIPSDQHVLSFLPIFSINQCFLISQYVQGLLSVVLTNNTLIHCPSVRLDADLVEFGSESMLKLLRLMTQCFTRENTFDVQLIA